MFFGFLNFSPQLRGKVINIVSVRVKESVSVERSLVFTVQLPKDDIDIDNLKWIGWEQNDQGKYLPRCAAMASTMDPERYPSLFRSSQFSY